MIIGEIINEEIIINYDKIIAEEINQNLILSSEMSTILSEIDGRGLPEITYDNIPTIIAPADRSHS